MGTELQALGFSEAQFRGERFAEPEGLQLGAHAPVQHEDPLIEL